MSGTSKIEWTGKTWNPIRARLKADTKWGYHCEKVSTGCRNCYAERMNGRMLPAWGTGLGYTVPNREKVEIYLDEAELLKPLKWRKPTRVFPCSMTDLFADFVPDEMIGRMAQIMDSTPRHTYQVLTKRSTRMRDLWRSGVPSHVWLGVSVEDEANARKRIRDLQATPAAVKWISYEPALGPVNWTPDLMGGISWIVIGGESGPGARPFDVQWARQTITACLRNDTAVFLKQLGAHVVDRNDAGFDGDGYRAWPMGTRHEELDNCYQGAPVRVRLEDRKGGNPAEWPQAVRVREMPSKGEPE
jgi:protein gp37